MVIEHKSVRVGGVSEIKDEGDGVVTAYVSVTNIEDNVKDVILPGAYERTLKKRTPKGIWGHQWNIPTSKTLSSKELMPGSPELPKKLSDGTPWPADAGALKIKMQFNLDTKRGREAYSDVRFFDDQQEWSIGYTVPDGKSYKKDGVRYIKELDLFEYSAVLFGAMPHARTHSVKDAQLSMKLLEGVSALEIKSLEEAVEQFRKDNIIDAPENTDSTFVGDEEGDVEDAAMDDSYDADTDDDDEELTELDEDEEELDEDEPDEDDEDSQVKLLSESMDIKDIRLAHTMIGKVLGVLEPDPDGALYIDMGTKALIEAKATGYDTIEESVDAIEVTLDDVDMKDLKDAARQLDQSLANEDQEGAMDAANALFDVLEKVMEGNEEDISLKTVARTVADKAGTDEEEEDDEEEYSDAPDEDDDDDDEYDDDSEKLKHIGLAERRKKKSFAYVSSDGIQYKSIPFAGREFGFPQGGEDLSSLERQAAYIGTLPNPALVAAHHLVKSLPGNVKLRSLLYDEIDTRLYADDLSEEEKLHIGSAMSGGQHGRGGGRHRQAAEGRTPGGPKNFGETGMAKKPAAKRLKKAVKGVKKAGTAAGRAVRITSGKKVVKGFKSDNPEGYETKRQFTADQRRAAASSGHAMDDESFPIENEKDLRNAIRACGRAKDKDAAKAHIKKRAKAMGKEYLLPNDWKTATIDTNEIKSLEDYVAGL